MTTTVTRAGVAAVARQELRLRLRAGRWKLLLLAWLVLLGLFTVLTTLAAGSQPGLEDDGVLVFGALVLFVLGLALLVVPSLAAQSVNGDRERGTLASLQVTRLTAWEITLGKFLAAWGTAVLFLLLTAPYVLVTVVQGGVGLGRVVVVTLVLALLLGTVCAVSLMLSALLARTTTSGVLSYLAVGALTIGTLIAFGLGTYVTAEDVVERYPVVDCATSEGFDELYGGLSGEPVPARPDGSYAPEDLPDGCSQRTESFATTRTRTDRVWWLLAPNPFVVVADAAPSLGPVPEGLGERERRAAAQARDLDVLGQLGDGVREARQGPVGSGGPATAVFVPSSELEEPAVEDPGAVWPYGLAFDVLLATGALTVTARRLRTPSRTLPRGQRVA